MIRLWVAAQMLDDDVWIAVNRPVSTTAVTTSTTTLPSAGGPPWRSTATPQ